MDKNGANLVPQTRGARIANKLTHKHSLSNTRHPLCSKANRQLTAAIKRSFRLCAKKSLAYKSSDVILSAALQKNVYLLNLFLLPSLSLCDWEDYRAIELTLSLTWAQCAFKQISNHPRVLFSFLCFFSLLFSKLMHCVPECVCKCISQLHFRCPTFSLPDRTQNIYFSPLLYFFPLSIFHFPPSFFKVKIVPSFFSKRNFFIPRLSLLSLPNTFCLNFYISIYLSCLLS